MPQLGPIVMPCRYCDVAPGQGCDWRITKRSTTRADFHAIRIGDAKLASDLITDETVKNLLEDR